MGIGNAEEPNSSEPLINPTDSNGVTNAPEPTLRTSIIHACLTANSTTLYTYDDPNFAPLLNINYAELVSNNIGAINSLPESRADNYNVSSYLMTYKNDQREAEGKIDDKKKDKYVKLVLYYNKKLMKNNDLITLVILCGDEMLKSFVYNLMDKIMFTYLNAYYESPGLTANMTTTTNFEFKIKMRDIIVGEQDKLITLTQNYGAVNGDLTHIREIMNSNIDKILDRGQSLDTLIDKTQNLNTSANSFRRTAISVKRKFWWSNVKSIFITCLIATIVLYFLIGLECGLPFYKKCVHPSPPHQPIHSHPSK